VWGASILLAAVVLAAAYALIRLAAPAAAPRATVAPPAPTVFVPIASDGDDLSNGVQIQQLDHPAFQFGTGGATLTVWVRAHDGGAPLDGARLADPGAARLRPGGRAGNSHHTTRAVAPRLPTWRPASICWPPRAPITAPRRPHRTFQGL